MERSGHFISITINRMKGAGEAGEKLILYENHEMTECAEIVG
jgi:hypothetical protein